MKDKPAYIAIFTLALFVYLFCNQYIPITDPVEANYALTAKEMINTADWLSPRIYGQPWYDKPVFFYWLLAIAFKIFGFSAWAARFVPACFSALSIVMIYAFVAHVSSRWQGMLAAMLLGTTLQFFLMSKLIITDTLLFFFANGALVCFYLGYLQSRATRIWYMLMYPCLALAVLTKGPIGLLIPVSIIAVFLYTEQNWHEWRAMYILRGGLIFCLLALPWYGAMYIVHGEPFLTTFLGVHNYLRATVAEHPKDNVFYYYIIIFILGMLPWSGLAIKGMITGLHAAWSRHALLAKFCLIWSAVYFIFYSLVATKYLTYTFPMLFPVVMLSVCYLAEPCMHDAEAKLNWWIGLPFTAMLAGLLSLVYQYLTGLMVLAATVGFVVLNLLTLYQLMCENSPQRKLMSVCCATLLVWLFSSATLLPAATNLRSGKLLGEHLLLAYQHYDKVGIYKDYSTSAVFYSGKLLTRLVPDSDAAKIVVQSLDWSSKYTMPTQPLADFVQSSDEQVMAIVAVGKEADFMKAAQAYHPVLLEKNNDKAFYALSSH